MHLHVIFGSNRKKWNFQRLEIKGKKYRVLDGETDEELEALEKNMSKIDKDIDQIKAKDQISMYSKVVKYLKTHKTVSRTYFFQGGAK